MIPEYTAADWFVTTGRGDTAVIMNVQAPGFAVGEQIIINGHQYTIRGVERHCLIGIDERRYVGYNVGVLVGKRIAPTPDRLEQK